MISRLYRYPVLVLFFLCLPIASFAFQTDNAITQDSTLEKKVEAISVVRIVTEIEDLKSVIQVNSKRIQPGKRLKRIDSLYLPANDFIKEREESSREFITLNPNRPKIDNLIKKWEEYIVQLSGWESEIMTYVDRNMRLLESFKSETKVWELTYEKAKEQGVPRELLSNIEGVLKELNEIVEETKVYNYNYLRLQTRINRLLETSNEVLTLLYEKKGSETYDLFYQRHPPIWTISFGPNSAEDKSGIDDEDFSDYSSRISEMLQTHKAKLFLLLFLSVLLTVFIYYLKKRVSEAIGEEEASKTGSESYLIYTMTGVVLAFLLFFITKLQFVSGTRNLGDFLNLVLLTLSIFLILHRLPRRFKPLLFFALLFMILDAVKTYVWFYSGHYRIYMIFEALLMIGGLYYFTHPYLKTRHEMQSNIGKFMIRLVPVVYLLCVGSVIANILGYTNLADLSLKVCTQSGIMVIVVYALLLVLESIVISWLKQRFKRSESPNLIKLAFLKRRTMQFLRVAVTVLFSISFLKIIDQWRNISDFFSSLMTEPYKVGNLTFTLEAVLMFLLVLILSYFISKLIAFLIGDSYGALSFLRLPKGVPAAISLVLRYLVVVFGIILALSYLEVDLSKFNLMAGALGLGIGFGLQNVISNFVSGLILVFERPILPGDTIEVNNLFGKVQKIGIRSSNISTYDGAEVVVPNNNLISNDLINWTLSDSIKRVEILIGTTYDADPNEVLSVLRDCALKFDYVITEKEPMVLFTGFGDSSLDFRLLFWVPFDMGLRAKSDVNVEIFNQFSAHGIKIPFPQRDVFIKNLPENSDEDTLGISERETE
ncbi:mechanosensitive ion channel family protein [Robiginitalea aurantiaca]|uniref:Mechanosensitive ion channel n=1 Tax=Robiginitalea aurantiaca TaxID=3056915 RepID=A0ABT7WH56_9FLAO|nr:mechanosensitive ion channel domain-containing protein [Robiginitalea aurantiaca]MDM9632252.1 mechanosensitive ion channel [Robiginitalea aurantiaca]